MLYNVFLFYLYYNLTKINFFSFFFSLSFNVFFNNYKYTSYLYDGHKFIFFLSNYLVSGFYFGCFLKTRVKFSFQGVKKLKKR